MKVLVYNEGEYFYDNEVLIISNDNIAATSVC
jgi:hypothetical protein